MNQNKVLNNITLNFTSKTIQRKYESNFKELKKNQSYCVLLLVNICSTFLIIRNLVLPQKDYKSAALLSIQSAILIPGMFFMNKFRYIKEFMCLISVGNITYLVGSQYFTLGTTCDSVYKQLPSYIQIAVGAFYHLIVCVTCTFLLSSWVLKCILIYLPTEILLICLSRNNSLFFLLYHIFLFSVCIFFYLDDRSIKIQFYQQYIQNIKLKDWKKLLENIMPSSIFIAQISQDDVKSKFKFKSVNYEIQKKSFKITFANQFLQNSLLLSPDSQHKDINLDLIEEYLEQLWIIDLTAISQDEKLLKQKVSLKTYLCSNCFEKSVSLNSLNSHLNCFLTTNDAIKLNGYINTGQKIRYYDLTLVECIWQDQYSIMCVMNEITDKIKLQKQLEELNQYKDLLLANVSHDLKTPLSAISSYNDMTLKKMLVQQNNSTLAHQNVITQAELVNNLQIIQRNTYLLQHLIMDILDFSQIKQGKLRLNKSFFNIQDLITDLEQLFSHQISYKGLYLKFEEKYEWEITKIYNDRNRLIQILINLISNAIKYTFQGGITVKFSNLKYDPKIVCIDVIDTGIGIPKEIQGQLFNYFQTYDHYQSCNKEGIGLGLSICKSLCSQLGPKNSLKIDSENQKGSTFSLEITVEETISEETTDAQRELPNKTQKKQTKASYSDIASIQSFYQLPDKNYSILIVDDSVYSLMSLEFTLQSLLQNSGQIHKAYSGKQGLDIMRKQYESNQSIFKLIFIDVDMPLMDGFDTMEKMEKLMHDSYRINQNSYKFVMCTTFGQQRIEQNKGLINIKFDYLEKPINVNKLIDLLNDLQ